MSDLQTILLMFAGMIGVGLLTEFMRAAIWCFTGWLFFRKWFRK